MDDQRPPTRELEYPTPLLYGYGEFVGRVVMSFIIVGILAMAWLIVDGVVDPGEAVGPIPVRWLLVTGAVFVVVFWVNTIRQVSSAVAWLARVPRRTQVEGVVVEKKVYTKRSKGGGTYVVASWVAIDDGTRRGPIRALRIREHLWPTVVEGDVVCARIGRRRGMIVDLKVLESPPGRPRPPTTPRLPVIRRQGV